MHYTIQSVLAQAWQQFSDETFTVVPHVLASLLVFIVGLLLGMIVSRVARWALRSSDIDRAASRIGLMPSLEAVGITSPLRLLIGALQAAIILLTSILALYSLDARLASDLAERFFLYLPHLVVAMVILAAGFVLARFLARSALIAAVNSDIRAARLLSGFTRVAVMIVAAAMAFEHLGISRETVLTAFAILFGGVTLAVSIAGGLAMQDVVRGWVAGQLAPPAQAEADKIEHW